MRIDDLIWNKLQGDTARTLQSLIACKELRSALAAFEEERDVGR